ncbi:MAG: 4-hydroxy-tetrahydrodipicolinate reductase [Armatimonadetes bacterium]|nr:4-hydroxy-tetrahydrodipicolinate reductase [Armatimonadota bacterium]
MDSSDRIPVVVAGASGRMGRETIQTLLQQVDMQLVAAIGHTRSLGQDVAELAEEEACGVVITDDREAALDKGSGGVLVDFSVGSAVKENVLAALQRNIACVVGATNIPAGDEDEIAKAAGEKHSVLIAPNFALGAVLMMKFAREASRYYRWAEIIELHHEKKLDAPSGTARRTADLMRRARTDGFRAVAEGEDSIKGCRGGSLGGIRIHSIRMPGLLAHQEVLFGGNGETLTIRHDSRSRESFMPGVILAIHKVRNIRGLMVGLENILD